MQADILEKLKKVKALAEQGVDGEQGAARVLLNTLLDKYGITEDQLNDDQVDRYYFKYNSKEERRLIVQLFSMVADTTNFDSWTYSEGKEVSFNMTEYQNIQMCELWDFHRKAYRKEVNLMKDRVLSAYIMQHDIYAETQSEPKEDTRTEEEKAQDRKEQMEAQRVAGMMSNERYAKKLNQ